MFMQALCKSNSDVLVNFDKILDLVTNINYLMQQKTYGFKTDEQQAKYVSSESHNNNAYFKEEAANPNILEQEVADAIMEKKNIEYPVDKY